MTAACWSTAASAAVAALSAALLIAVLLCWHLLAVVARLRERAETAFFIPQEDLEMDVSEEGLPMILGLTSGSLKGSASYFATYRGTRVVLTPRAKLLNGRREVFVQGANDVVAMRHPVSARPARVRRCPWKL